MVSENQKSNVNGQLSDVKAGFTLPELMIAVSILVIISLIAVVSFRGFDQTSKLRGARDQIIGDLQDMQSWARSGKLVNFCQDGNNNPEAGKGICTGSGTECTTASGYSCKPGLPAGGYGVYFYNSSPDKYVLFADIFDGSTAMGGVKGCDASLGCSNEILIDGVKSMPGSINYGSMGSFRNLNGNGKDYGSNSFPIQFIFQPSNAIVVRDLNQEWPAVVEKISISNSSNSAWVYVNTSSGLIYGDTDNLEPSGS